MFVCVCVRVRVSVQMYLHLLKLIDMLHTGIPYGCDATEVVVPMVALVAPPALARYLMELRGAARPYLAAARTAAPHIVSVVAVSTALLAGCSGALVMDGQLIFFCLFGS